MAAYSHPHYHHYFEQRMMMVEKDETLSPEEKEKRMKKLKDLAETPREQWTWRHFLFEEEMSIEDGRPAADDAEPSQLDQDIHDYEPKYWFAQRSYNPEYHQAKKRFISGPFKMPDPLAFHLVIVRLMENEDICQELLDKDGEELLTDAAKAIISGEKSFHEALHFVWKEMDHSRKSMRRSYMTTASYIGCPLTPPDWAVKLTDEMRERGEIPEKLYTGYEPSIEEVFVAMEIQEWNDALDSFVCIANGSTRPDWVPEDLLELNQFTDPVKAAKAGVSACLEYQRGDYISIYANMFAMEKEINRSRLVLEENGGPSTQ